MTQQEQENFRQCLESALSWIQAVHERLRTNDDTEGPRSALQARLRETEVIRISEHEGWLKVDMALVAAEVLLQTGDEAIKGQTQARVKELKALWEETSIYITHCHSRIEWVWLHWAEYLRAQEEFGRWLLRMQRALDPHLDLQLGVCEKVWHLEQYRVLLDDAHAQGPLLKRLLEEASDLHDRTEDPSVGPKAQESLWEAYTQIRDKAEERVSLLQKIAEEHRVFDASIHQFWAWIDSVSVVLTGSCDTEDLPESTLCPQQAKDTPENPVSTLQELCETVDREEATLQHLEGAAESVKANTSPQGADKVSQEAKELRWAWEGLRQRLRLEEDRQCAAQCAQVEHSSLCEGLRADASRLLLLLDQLDQELEPSGREGTEDETEVLWRKYTDVHRAVKAEEPHVEQLKVKLTELFRVSKGPMPLFGQVLAVMKQYQGLRSRAFRLLKGRETALRQLLLDPLRGFSKWSLLVTQILEASNEVTESSCITRLVQSMEKLLKDSKQLQEHLEQLQAKGYLLAKMFGLQRAKSLGVQLSTAVRERQKKHDHLLQRRSHLQDLLSRSKDFGERYESVLKWLRLREKCITTVELKPDIPTKKAFSGELMVILKDVEEHEAHLIALQALVLPSPANQHKLSHLCTEWKELCKAMKGRVRESEQNTADHHYFQEKLFALQQGLQETMLRLEPFCSLKGELGADNWQADAERVLGELPERELELRRVEALSQRVLTRTSEEGKGKILEDLQRLNDSWTSLHMRRMDLHRFLNGNGVKSMTGNEGKGVGRIQTNMDLWVVEGEDAQGQKLWTGHEEDFVGPSVGWRVGPAVENIGYGNYIKAGRGLGIRDEDITLGQYERPVGRLGAGDEGGFDIEIEGKWFWQDAKAERELEAGGKGKGVRTELILGFGDEEELNARYDGQDGLGAGDEVLDLGKRPEGELETGDEVSVDEALRQQDASVSQVNAGVQEMDLESIYSQSSTRYHREGIKQQSGENQIFCWGLSGEEQGKVTGDESFPQESSGTCVYQLRQHTQEEFEAWLQAEHAKLSRILRQRRRLTANELKLRQRELEELRSHVGLGQSFLQGLLTSQGGAGADDPCLEELRYRWVLHKSKLQDAGDLRHHLGDKDGNALQKEPLRKVKKSSGILQRACCVALPIQLLLLSLLLLAFFLPLTDEGTSCSFVNNFARSFRLMLHYRGPPPT